MVKYLAVRRILFKNYVVDSGGLLVYGLAAAAGFATLENIQYGLANGFATVVLRMVTSIPLHCCTGMMIGTYLGARKFLGLSYRCYQHFLFAMAGPVLIHGTYDFILLLPASVLPQGALRAAGAITVLTLGLVASRVMWLKMDGICIVHVKDMLQDGRVSQPRCCCCECDCCTAICIQQDPMLSQAQQQGLEKQHQRLEQQQQPDAPRENSNLSSGSGKFVRSTTSFFHPEVPKCMTAEKTCPGCGNLVHVQLFFPSDCPYCGNAFPDPVLQRSFAQASLNSRYNISRHGGPRTQERHGMSGLQSESGEQQQQQQQQQQEDEEKSIDPAYLRQLIG